MITHLCGDVAGLCPHGGLVGDAGTSLMDGVMLGRAHGVANVVGALWPLLHISSFEMVFGPKTDRWLVKTVAELTAAAF